MKWPLMSSATVLTEFSPVRPNTPTTKESAATNAKPTMSFVLILKFFNNAIIIAFLSFPAAGPFPLGHRSRPVSIYFCFVRTV